MATRIRLFRMGKKKRPFYRIVVSDSRTKRDGKYIESLGYYNPITNPPEIKLDEERAIYWLLNGASPSETAKALLSKQGIINKFREQKRAKNSN